MQETLSHCHRIAAISNPRSGKNKRGGFDKFSRLVQGYPYITHYVAHQANEIITALTQCKQNNTFIIIVNGGDGTLQLILTFLRKNGRQEYDPKILLLRAGTTSMNYGDVGCRGTHQSILKKLALSEKSNNTAFDEVQRTSIRMQLLKDKKIICGMFFGAGAIYSGILYCRQNLHTRGMRGEMGPSIAMLRYLFDWITTGSLVKPVKAVVHSGSHETIEGVFTILIGTSLHRLLMGVFPFWGVRPVKDHFSLTLIKQDAPKPLIAFSNILRGRAPQIEHDANNYYSLASDSVEITVYGGFTLDGELFGEEGQCTEIKLQATKPVTFLV